MFTNNTFNTTHTHTYTYNDIPLNYKHWYASNKKRSAFYWHQERERERGREGGRLWVGPQHRSEITNIDTPSGLLTSYYNTGMYKSK